MTLPQDYLERVYAGVLGKLIGVYLGRPFEGWWNDRIESELGEVNYYVNERMPHVHERMLPVNVRPHRPPLIVTDDDISGTFTFLRALTDYNNGRALTAQQIGQTWLNYIIEKKTILWWGGMGNSTEHTAYLRLKHGMAAPDSGSIRTNGKVVAEQIGSQIFIDGWAMIAPGDPALAADLARRASSVSHDGEAIYGAQVIAAMEAQAFVESDLNKLLDCGVSFIPQDSVIAHMISDLREWRDEIGDWREARKLLDQNYGYDKYGGNCHMVPNHGVIMLSLLYGNEPDPGLRFQKSLMIANTAGWDTDCNSGNVGCLLGIKDGLVALDTGPDWRGPVADRLYLPTADGGRAISDAVQETYRVVNIGRSLQEESAAALVPKDGARFHFELPGAVQGFMAQQGFGAAPVQLHNVLGHSARGRRSLAIRFEGVAPAQPAHISTATFIPPEALNMVGYELLASPTIYPGQTVHARVEADTAIDQPITCTLVVQVYGKDDVLVQVSGPSIELSAGEAHVFKWQVPDMQGDPIATIGLEISAARRATGSIYLDYLTWDGTPAVTLGKGSGKLWRKAWVSGVDHFHGWSSEPFRVLQDEGTGLLMTGTREWTDYTVRSTLTPHMGSRFGLAARVQGMRRFYALVLTQDGKAQLIKALDTADGHEHVLAEVPFAWEFGSPCELALQVQGQHLVGSINGKPVLDVIDGTPSPLTGGGIALLITEGRMATEAVTVS